MLKEGGGSGGRRGDYRSTKEISGNLLREVLSLNGHTVVVKWLVMYMHYI